ncbi:MAG: protein kinase [Cyanobacteria bacterium P01_D01_bin.2]
MICCLNPDCLVPVNPDGVTACQSCGRPLIDLLRNRYRPIKPLGQGGFGKTYLAEDVDRLNTRCVIKQFVRQSSNKTFDKALTLFNQEAVRLNELGEHPQIPSLLAYFEQQGNFYLVQQEIEGNTLLQEVKKEGPFDEAKIRSLLSNLLPVLQFIHDRNVVHRDINPTNIICRQHDQKPVLIDFGIAKQLVASLVDTEERTGTRIGTEGYSPIEQLRSGEAYPSSDLYSLGATCICLLTGRKPEKLYSPLEGRWLWQDHLVAAGRSVTPALAAILDRMLKDFINERYRSAAEVLQEVEALPAYHRTVPGWTRQRPQDNNNGPLSDAISSGQDVSRNLNQHLISEEFRQAHPPTAPPQRRSGSQPISRAKPGPTTGRRSAASSKGQSATSPGQKKSGPMSKGRSSPVGSSGPPSGSTGRTSGRLSMDSIGSSDVSIGGRIYSRGMATKVQSSGPKSAPSRWVCVNTLEGHKSWVSTVAFSPQQMVLASGGWDDTVNVWDAQTGRLMVSLKGHARGINGLAFSPRDQILASCSDDDTIRLWDVGKGSLLHLLKGHQHDVTSLAIGRRGSLLISGSEDRTVGVWDIAHGKLVKSISGNAGMIRCVDISPDEELVVSGGFDNKIRLWHLGNGQVFRVLPGHLNSVNDVLISPDGRLIVSAGKDRSIKLWSMRSGNLIHTLKGHTGEVNAIALAPNQRTVVSASGDSCIKIWDTKTGELVETLTDHSNSVTAIAIHPNGQVMASASADKTIKLWQKE